MKKIILIPSVFHLLAGFLIGCSNNSEKKDAKTKTSNETTMKEPETVEEKKSMSDKQALSEVKKYILENKKKFSKYGILVTINLQKVIMMAMDLMIFSIQLSSMKTEHRLI